MKNVIFLFAFFFVSAMSVCVQAVPTIYFGEDLSAIESGDFSNSIKAHNAFLSNLKNVKVESFENFAPASAGLTIDFGEAGMATLTGGYVSGSWDAGAIASGRFSTTPSGDQFLEVQTSPDPEGGTGTFSLEFETEQSAFGFFGTDFEGSQTDLIFETVIGETFTLNIPFSNPSPTGSALFWGFIDTERQFTKVTFNGVNLFRDWFGFDDFTIGTEDQVVSPVPEPATMALLGIGLIGLAAVRRKRTSRL